MKFGPGPKPASASPGKRWATEADKKPSLAKVIGTLKHAVEVAQGLEAEKERRLTLDNYVAQVELLQTAFTSLADAVLEELDDLAGERLKLQREQATWSNTMQDLEDKVQSKLCKLGSLEDRLDVKLAVAAELPGKLEALSRQQRAGESGLDTLRSDIKVLHAQLSKVERSQALQTSQAASIPLNPTQCSQVKDFAHDAVREQVPGLLAVSISNHVPPMIDEVIERRSSELRRDFTSTADMLAGDVSRLAKEGATLRADVSSVAGAVKRNEMELAGTSSRLGRLESNDANNPKASMRLVAALEDKMESLAAQQTRYSKSVESVVAALVDDTVSLSRSTRQLETHVNHQQAQLQDTKEALLRSAQVFSQLLKVPSPVSTTLWSASPSRSHLSAAVAAVASPHSSPLKISTAAAGVGSPMLSSKYASLLASLS